MLVLDEATSALDNVTEHEIAKTIGALQGMVTIVIVAHRLSTVRHADTLIFLKDGQVEAEGTFEAVRAAERGLRPSRGARRTRLTTSYPPGR